MTSLVQSKRITTGGGFDVAATPGNTIIAFINHRDGVPGDISGFSAMPVTGGGPGAQACRGNYRVVQGGDGNSFSFSGTGAVAVIMEFTGALTFVAAGALDEPGNDTVAYFGDTCASGAGKAGVTVGDDMGASDGQTPVWSNISGPAGAATIVDQRQNGSAPSWCVAYKIITSSAANEYFRGTKSQSVNTGGIIAFFQDAAVTKAQILGFIG